MIRATGGQVAQASAFGASTASTGFSRPGGAFGTPGAAASGFAAKSTSPFGAQTVATAPFGTPKVGTLGGGLMGAQASTSPFGSKLGQPGMMGQQTSPFGKFKSVDILVCLLLCCKPGHSQAFLLFQVKNL